MTKQRLASTVDNILEYSGNPQEMFVRVQRTADYLISQGVDMASDKSILEFFKTPGNKDKIKKAVKDTQSDACMGHIFMVLSFDLPPNNVYVKRALETFKSFL